MAIEKKFVKEAVGRLLLKEFMRKETQRAGFGGIEIQRTPMGMRVSIVAERPGMVIGRKGATINALTDDLRRRFHVENPQIEVVEAGHDANVNAQIMAQKLAEALERGWHFRRAGHSTVQRVMGAGAQGCQVIVSGKLTGQRHRSEKFSQGHIKYCGETADRVMDVGFAVAKKKLGVIGCTVRIMRAEWKLPDNITIIPPQTPTVPGAKAEETAEVAAPAPKPTPKQRAAPKRKAAKPQAAKTEKPAVEAKAEAPSPKKEEKTNAPPPKKNEKPVVDEKAPAETKSADAATKQTSKAPEEKPAAAKEPSDASAATEAKNEKKADDGKGGDS
jgi:small subunit ribosomal protein S3